MFETKLSAIVKLVLIILVEFQAAIQEAGQVHERPGKEHWGKYFLPLTFATVGMRITLNLK